MAMGESIHGKTALVTGGAKRLGRAIVSRLHGAGMRVAIHYHRSVEEAAQLRDELDSVRPGSASIHSADLLDSQSLSALVRDVADAHGGLHTLINNGSSFYPTVIGETTDEQWNDLIGTNVKAPFFLSQAAFPYLRESGGCIVNMADIYGERPLPGHAVYNMGKAALIMLTQTLALELAPSVRVNAIAPGPILHPSHLDEVSNGSDLAPISTPLDRWGDVGEITAAALFLVREASFTTGTVLPVDGGRRIAGF